MLPIMVNASFYLMLLRLKITSFSLHNEQFYCQLLFITTTYEKATRVLSIITTIHYKTLFTFPFS